MLALHRMALAAVTSILLALSIAEASEPGDRAFTPLGGASLGAPASVGSRGNPVASVPLLLPSPRGGLPLPLAVTYTGSNLVGAAGLGWDVPILGVTHQRNLSRRKPLHRFQGLADPTPADRIFVDIGSGPMLMSPTDTAGVHQTFSSGYFKLVQVANTAFVGRDANGLVWLFEKLPALYNDDFFPLVRISDANGNNRLDLRYDVYDEFSSQSVKRPPSITVVIFCWHILLISESMDHHDSEIMDDRSID
jgi:hypothetical protein